MLPFLLSPYYKELIWGGSFLAQFKNVSAPHSHIGESWEVSSLPGRESVVASGPMKGMKLSEVCETYSRELMGEKASQKFGSRFPLLVKFIDAAHPLSIQVHPGSHHPEAKTEMWYILRTMPQSKILLGFSEKIDGESFSRLMADGNVEPILRIYDSEPGDVFLIPSGQVHGIGSGIFLVEIQQASDTTFRIYDFDRLGSDGKPRELHREQALESIDFANLAPEKMHPRDNTLINTDYFSVDRRRLNGDSGELVDNDSFTVVVCTDGNLKLVCGDVELPLPQGHTAMIPADTPTRLCGAGEALLIVP